MASRDPLRPNVLVVTSDDQGVWATGRTNPEIETPVLDRLAAEGVALDAFFCTSPVCSPARASLLTGEIPSRHGVHDWIRDGNTGAGAVDFLAGRTTYVDLLAAAGWRCGLVGKWHLGASDQPRPAFTHWYAHEKGGGPYYGAVMHRGVHGADGTWRGTQRVVAEDYLTDHLSAEACAFLDAEAGRDEPFALNLNYTAPHVPWIDQHPKEYTDRYADTAFTSCPQPEPHPWRLDFSTEMAACYDDPRPNLVGLFAAVSAMDAGIGRVVERLESLGLAEHTLVLFCSDNGFNAGHHGLWGKGNATYPANMYDTSVRVPALAWQPGRVPPGRAATDLLSGYDLLPTLLEWTGLEPPASYRGPGTSFAGVLAGLRTDAGQHARRPRHVVVHDEYGPTRMIRTATHKYVHRTPDGPHELYDLLADPGEEHNLVAEAEHDALATELRTALHDWFGRHEDPASSGAQLPVTGVGQSAPLSAPAPAGAFHPLPSGEPRWLAAPHSEKP